jgi:hypothetical protein
MWGDYARVMLDARSGFSPAYLLGEIPIALALTVGLLARERVDTRAGIVPTAIPAGFVGRTRG